MDTSKSRCVKTDAKIASRRVGAELQKQYPDVAKEVKAVCKVILLESDENALRPLAEALLSEQVKDPMLVADISDLITILELEIEDKITEEQLTLIKIVAYELERGIDIWIGKKL